MRSIKHIKLSSNDLVCKLGPSSEVLGVCRDDGSDDVALIVLHDPLEPTTEKHRFISVTTVGLDKLENKTIEHGWELKPEETICYIGTSYIGEAKNRLAFHVFEVLE
jgi:hypothetical protein